MRPEEMYTEAAKALEEQNWPKANAYASVGILSLLIGGAKAIEALGMATEHS